jgi:L-ascorbate metabolism protein UlaG (beta-lactamase superfamily)
MPTTAISITRICNASVLINIGGHTILTDPYFINVPFFGVKELAAIHPQDLPPLTAILGCHDVGDHWQMKGLADYPHNKDDVHVFVAMESQAQSARKIGFKNVEVLEWGEHRTIAGNLSIEAVKAQKMMKWTVNNYVLRCEDASILFGSEARDLSPLAEYGAKNRPVDVAVFPVNGVQMLGFYPLVMRGDEAVEGAKLIGAKKLFVIHDAHTHLPGLMSVKSSGDDADAAALNHDNLAVIRMPTGEIWSI